MENTETNFPITNRHRLVLEANIVVATRQLQQHAADSKAELGDRMALEQLTTELNELLRLLACWEQHHTGSNRIPVALPLAAGAAVVAIVALLLIVWLLLGVNHVG